MSHLNWYQPINGTPCTERQPGGLIASRTTQLTPVYQVHVQKLAGTPIAEVVAGSIRRIFSFAIATGMGATVAFFQAGFRSFTLARNGGRSTSGNGPLRPSTPGFPINTPISRSIRLVPCCMSSCYITVSIHLLPLLILARAIKRCRPDLILHLAAQSVLCIGYQDPWETFSTNTMGTASVLEAIRTLDQPCGAVLITSDKCDENREQVWEYREQNAMGDHGLSGGSQAAAEWLIRVYRDSFFPASRIDQYGIKIAIARAGNAIGRGDWTSHALIVDAVKMLSNEEPICVRGPNAFRPWQHVPQALSGYLTLATRLLTTDNPDFRSGWNIGPLPANEIPVREVVERFTEAWGSGSWIDAGDPNAPRAAGILMLTIDKALRVLNWKPVWDVDETIRQTARWYRQRFNSCGESMQAFSMSQISGYEEAMRSATQSGSGVGSERKRSEEINHVV